MLSISTLMCLIKGYTRSLEPPWEEVKWISMISLWQPYIRAKIAFLNFRVYICVLLNKAIFRPIMNALFSEKADRRPSSIHSDTG